jgi:uncharacterized GH25 family protein
MVTRISFLLLTAFFASPMSMPNVWISAGKYSVKAGDKVSLDMLHHEKVHDISYGVKKSELVKVTLQSLNTTTDLLPSFNTDGKSTLEVSLPKEGSYLVGVRSSPTIVALSADSMNVYAKDNDLEDVKYDRESKKLMDKRARVTSSWYASVLLQAGITPDDAFKKRSGYPLEIVPEKNPYAMKIGEKLRFTILWNGTPLFGARVIVRIMADNSTGVQHIYSGKDGVIEVPLGSRGTWVVTVAKMIPSRNPDADWQAYQSSLSFGY